MSLSEIPSEIRVFIDANIFVYHFSGPTELTPTCSAFLRRIEEGNLAAFTSLTVLAEVLHRLMIIGAMGSGSPFDLFRIMLTTGPWSVFLRSVVLWSVALSRRNGAVKASVRTSRRAL